jgi:hypothetical protein
MKSVNKYKSIQEYKIFLSVSNVALDCVKCLKRIILCIITILVCTAQEFQSTYNLLAYSEEFCTG